MKKVTDIPILYEDTHILAINKPAGLVVHADGKTEEPVLTDWILKHFPKAKNVGEPIVTTDGVSISRPGIVHRLDRETSGVLLIAKTAKGHAHLKNQFQEHTIRKKYHAFLYGELTESWGIIDRPIGRSTSDFRKWSATRGARGELRPAQTWWTRIATRRGAEDNHRFSFIEAEPRTGRTHQIRVHFKAINHPVVCDKLYAAEKLPALGFTRTALHASVVSFSNVAGKQIVVSAPFPADFIHACGELGVEPPVMSDKPFPEIAQ